MKNCAYCGHKNTDEATHCAQCGTELVADPAQAEPSKPHDLSGVKAFFRYVILAFLVVLVYLLSFGPVTRYSARVISQTTTTNANGFVTQRAVQYPRWVGIMYYPAFRLTGRGDGIFSVLYWRYLEWWEPPAASGAN